jgi:hypothetical protein
VSPPVTETLTSMLIPLGMAFFENSSLTLQSLCVWCVARVSVCTCVSVSVCVTSRMRKDPRRRLALRAGRQAPHTLMLRACITSTGSVDATSRNRDRPPSRIESAVGQTFFI